MVSGHSITTPTTTTTTTTSSSTTSIPNDSKILCINFNQDQGCFAISHEQGFLVYNTDPIELRVKRNFHINSHISSRSNNNNSNGSSSGSGSNHRNNSTGSTGSNGSVSSLGSNNESTSGYKSNNKSGSGIGHISMLHRTNYLALIGGGENPKFPINKLIIWDDLKRKTSLLLEFDTPVLNVLLSRVRIIVVLIDQIIVYGFAAPPKKFQTFNTINNPLGIADLSVNSQQSTINLYNNGPVVQAQAQAHGPSHYDFSRRKSLSPANSSSSSSTSLKENGGNLITYTSPSSTTSISTSTSASVATITNTNNNTVEATTANPTTATTTTTTTTATTLTKPLANGIGSSYQTLAFPGRSMGQIQIVDVGNNHNINKHTINIIKAHKLNIRCLCLNRTGTLIASASITGTIIRIHSTRTTALLFEFRRGIDRAIITSMKFSHDDSKLAVLSDKHTLHVYNIDEKQHPSDTIGSNTKDGGGGLNRHHLLNGLPYLPNYFQSTWSFCSVNTNKYHTSDFEEANIGIQQKWTINDSNGTEGRVDEGIIGWSGNDSIIIIWKLKKIWEKYVIVETENHQYDLKRASWKRLDS